MTDERLRPGMHGAGVEPMQHMPGAIAIERKGTAPGNDAIEIMPRSRCSAITTSAPSAPANVSPLLR
jgi:hypothetical protein